MLHDELLSKKGWHCSDYTNYLPGINEGGHHNTYFFSGNPFYYWLRFNEATGHMTITKGTELENEEDIYDGQILTLEQIEAKLK